MARPKKEKGLPQDIASLRARLEGAMEAMPKRLKQTAQFILDHPNDVALERLTVLAERAEVQPSTFVRTAKFIGFSGASAMQRVFRNELYAAGYTPSYEERIRRFSESRDEEDQPLVKRLLDDFSHGCMVSLERLVESAEAPRIEDAIDILSSAKTVHVMGVRRSFPVACYAAYTLSQLHKPTNLIDGIGGMLVDGVSTVRKGDAVLVISFHSYADETIRFAMQARERGAKVIAVTDSSNGPIAGNADVALLVKESEVRGFRSIAATLCMLQALIIGFAHVSKEG